MIEDVVIEFEKVTKYPLLNFLIKYRDFMSNHYSPIENYFAGKTVNIDNEHLTALKSITEECKNVMAQFKNFANKFATCGYWELMEWLSDINDSIEKVNKLPKFLRTSLSCRGYTPTVQTQAAIGKNRTVEDLSDLLGRSDYDNSAWVDIMLGNDLNEVDWEIDELKPVTIYVNNRVNVVVTTVVDIPVGKRIYGKDILRKISFIDNDLQIVQEEDNIEQKVVILLELNRGDVPENRLFGKHSGINGSTMKQFMYPQLVSDIVNTFMQNDLFESVKVTEFKFKDSDLQAKVAIKTKYDYRTEKTMII